MAWIFLKEPLTCVDAIITAVCMTGIFLIARPTFLFGVTDTAERSESHFIGAIWAVVGLLAVTAISLIARKLRFSASDVYVLTFGHGIAATSACVILNSLIGTWSCPSDVTQWLYLICLGLAGFFGIYLYNLSFQTEKTLVVTVVFTSTIFISYLFQFAIFHEFPDIVSGVGIILLLLSVFAVFFQNWRSSRLQE
ncbi:putative solute carrier family 35 member G1 [Apostichopus japonicus]|uniref:Putative solute carrier family 35 member G1 n=1 Tax=Stichopus japonicus TaxID=307972 RepID=A0A2G8KI39_STIJA|nr:putative solute carrier family 35 member G1 [Apostichopus japonicus]